ncbi:MAG: RsmE family RNA methyltransferase, partial [Leuconostoc citreum]|nr:RsmE family RNA methyltransferase [Leuconostoc citreum]
MQRYFLNETITDEINLASNQSIFKHFGKVLRARVGTQAEFVDNNRRVVIAEVVTITPESMHLKVINTISAEAELPLEISVVVSPLKNDRSDWFVQKATELGVHHIIFTNMARTVTDWHKQQ